MKKFYCNGKIVYMNNGHTLYSAKFLLEKMQLATRYDNICQALEQDQDMLEVPGPGFTEVAMESEVCDCGFTDNESVEKAFKDLDKFFADMPNYDFPEQGPVEKALDDLDKFFVDMFGDEDYDYYALPNGKSAPYGLTGTELAAMKPDDKVFLVSLSQVHGVLELRKAVLNPDHFLVLVERDLIFATREKAVEAYNALFGDLYGTV